MNNKYNPEVEKEVLDWIGQLTGVSIEQGKEKVAAALRDGEILIKLVLTNTPSSKNWLFIYSSSIRDLPFIRETYSSDAKRAIIFPQILIAH